MKHDIKAIILEPQTANKNEAKRNQILVAVMMVFLAIVLFGIHAIKGN